MAAFSDQFIRHDPWLIEGGGPLAAIVDSMAYDAQNFLVQNRTRSEIISVCQQVERVLNMHTRKRAKDVSASSAEFNLLQLALHGGPVVFSDLPDQMSPGEPYAILALWKLADVVDIFDRKAILDPVDDTELWDEANEVLGIANKALQICAMHLGQIMMKFRVKKSEARKKSEVARQIVRVRWKDRDEHLRYALSLIPKFEFKSRIKVARAIADEIDAKFGRTYGDEIVDGWLKDTNWSKTI